MGKSKDKPKSESKKDKAKSDVRKPVGETFSRRGTEVKK
jgi:hypothetical protein